MTRSLAIIPIVHTETDLGQLAGHVRAQIGDQAWADKQRAVNAIWQRIAAWCDETNAERLHIFQDGLPDAPSAPQIVTDLAGKGSLNHCIVEGLIDRGAVLVGTESPELLLLEYEAATSAAEAIRDGRRREPTDAGLLARRDQYIADTIDTSLANGERGVLFIGMLHDVASKLPRTIDITYPLGVPEVHHDGVQSAQGVRR